MTSVYRITLTDKYLAHCPATRSTDFRFHLHCFQYQYNVTTGNNIPRLHHNLEYIPGKRGGDPDPSRQRRRTC
jgi:hypothetical protein